MAFIDYGAVVFKNGKQVNFDLFGDMLKMVGWTDADQTPHVDGNYFAYIGDEHLTVCFYKSRVLVLVDGEAAFEDWCGYGGERSIRHEIGGSFGRVGVLTHARSVGLDVWHFHMMYKGDSYHVVFGYGIDPEKRVWDRVKVAYLGKRLSRKVDRLYKRFGGLVDA